MQHSPTCSLEGRARNFPQIYGFMKIIDDLHALLLKLIMMIIGASLHVLESIPQSSAKLQQVCPASCSLDVQSSHIDTPECGENEESLRHSFSQSCAFFALRTVKHWQNQSNNFIYSYSFGLHPQGGPFTMPVHVSHYTKEQVLLSLRPRWLGPIEKTHLRVPCQWFCWIQ